MIIVFPVLIYNYFSTSTN